MKYIKSYESNTQHISIDLVDFVNYTDSMFNTVSMLQELTKICSHYDVDIKDGSHLESPIIDHYYTMGNTYLYDNTYENKDSIIFNNHTSFSYGYIKKYPERINITLKFYNVEMNKINPKTEIFIKMNMFNL